MRRRDRAVEPCDLDDEWGVADLDRAEGASDGDGSGSGKLQYFDVTADPLADGTTLFVGYSTSRSNLKKTSIASADPDGLVVFDRLPDDLAPGGELSLQYVDMYGDVVVDVPSVPGVEIAEPNADG